MNRYLSAIEQIGRTVSQTMCLMLTSKTHCSLHCCRYGFVVYYIFQMRLSMQIWKSVVAVGGDVVPLMKKYITIHSDQPTVHLTSGGTLVTGIY